MQNVRTTRRVSRSRNVRIEFTPSKDQVDTFAYRLMPEIKRYFADERVQKEFADWKNKHNSN